MEVVILKAIPNISEWFPKNFTFFQSSLTFIQSQNLDLLFSSPPKNVPSVFSKSQFDHFNLVQIEASVENPFKF